MLQRTLILISVLSSFLLASSPSFAQNERAALVQKIAAAQGLEEMFEQQIAAQRDSMKSYASKLFEQAITEVGGQPNAKQEAAFERFVAKAAALFSPKEITQAWIGAYGKELSDQELLDVLKYYQSPIGQKDVAATKTAMITYSTWINQESQARVTPLLKAFVLELQAAQN